MGTTHLIFDFDGVLVESNHIRLEGFTRLFHSYPANKVRELECYVHANGGISRYKKIRYFFNEILGRKITETRINELAEEYSNLVFKKIIDAEMVEGVLEFLEGQHKRHDMAVVSGSDQAELKRIMEAKIMDFYFCEILGSPVEKVDNLLRLLANRKWKVKECLYIGDSSNDLWACREVGLPFLGRQSGLIDWRKENVRFIEDLHGLRNILKNKARAL